MESLLLMIINAFILVIRRKHGEGLDLTAGFAASGVAQCLSKYL